MPPFTQYRPQDFSIRCNLTALRPPSAQSFSAGCPLSSTITENKPDLFPSPWSTWLHSTGHLAVNHPLLSVTKYSRVKCESICLADKTRLKWGQATGQWPRLHQQMWNRLAEKEKNRGVAMAQSNSRPHSHWNAYESCAQTNARRPQRTEATL